MKGSIGQERKAGTTCPSGLVPTAGWRQPKGMGNVCTALSGLHELYMIYFLYLCLMRPHPPRPLPHLVFLSAAAFKGPNFAFISRDKRFSGCQMLISAKHRAAPEAGGGPGGSGLWYEALGPRRRRFLRSLRSPHQKRQQRLSGATANSSFTQAFNLFIIHIPNHARGQRAAPSPRFPLRPAAERMLHYSARARLDASPRALHPRSLCPLVSLPVVSGHLCLSLSYLTPRSSSCGCLRKTLNSFISVTGK